MSDPSDNAERIRRFLDAGFNRGVHRGAFAGVEPTGRTVSLAGINVERLRDGLIVEHWSQFDLAGLMRQLTS